jgi:uroporphyrinogen-III synthase
MAETGFGGLRVLALENRRATEIATLIRNYGGVPTVVPVMREVPLESNEDAFSFAKALMAGQFDLVLFLTGAGAKILFNAVLTRFPREEFLAALKQTKIAVRGPKPVAALREFGVAADIVSPEPSTWREVLDSVDAAYPDGIGGLRVAVQEYGAVNSALLEGLAQRGAQVTRVPVYQWAVSDNLDEIRATVGAVLRGEFEVLLFLTGIQALPGGA